MTTFPAILSLLIVTLSLFIGGSSLWIGFTMQRRREKLQALLAFSAALFAICEIPMTLESADSVVLWGMRVQVIGAAFHVSAWIHYERVVRCYDQREVPSIELRHRIPDVALAIGALVSLIPQVSYPDGIRLRPVAWLGVVYQDPPPGILNDVVYGFMILGLIVVMFRFAKSARKGVQEAKFNVLAVAGLLICGFFDTLTANGVLSLPYLLSSGLFLSVVVSWVVVTNRFVQTAQAMEATSEALAETVVDTTLELNRTQNDLLRAERLAGLGRLAAGVAHEINTPAAVVRSNLQVVLDAMPQHREWTPEDEADFSHALSRSVAQMVRVADIVNDMLIAGRVAGSKETFQESVELLPLVESALEASGITDIEVVTDVPQHLCIVGHDRAIFPIVRNLLANARDAQNEVDSKAPISLVATESGGNIEIRVADRGAGISPEDMSKMFDPFFTTKAPGLGTGLGLSVSMGLVQALGGSLSCESEPGRTTMILRLPSVVVATTESS